MYQIDVSLQASEQLARVAGLKRVIRQKLSGIGDTAEQMLILQGGFFPGPAILHKIVDGWLVQYELDPERRRITVLSVEPRGAPGALDGVRGPLPRRTA
ncbi:MAG: hypothetical protein ACJ79H_13345 [Myxococcales bacterium]